MSALGAIGLLPQLGDLSPGVLQGWVAATLAQAAALRQHDAWLYPADAKRLPTADLLHGAWRQWVDDAEQLLERVRDSESAGGGVPGSEDLREAVARAACAIQISPTEMVRRREQVARGEVYTLEEVRRELRVGLRK